MVAWINQVQIVAPAKKAAPHPSDYPSSGSCKTYENMTLHPYMWTNARFVGGFSEASVPLEARIPAVQDFRDEPLKDASASRARMKGRYLFAGPVWNHFGHILTDSLHRLWPVLDQPEAYDGIIFLQVPNLRPPKDGVAKIPQLALDMMKLMRIPDGIPKLYVTEPTRVDQLDIPVIGSSRHFGVRKFYRPYLERYQENISRSVKTLMEKAPRKLFYSRSHSLRDGGVLGISYFEEQMRSRGFVSCVPEEMSLKLQLSYVLAAEEIVFEEGSAIHITDILSSFPGRAHMLRRRSSSEGFSTTLMPRAGHFTDLVAPGNVRYLPDRNGNMSPASLTLYANPEEVANSLRQQDLPIGDFDEGLYNKIERRDLGRCPSHSEQAKKKRLSQLQSHQGARSGLI
ncbi:MAG: hypothetical protein CNE89_06320 [Sphingomonadaceae bacterium MED-G03]|nr:MAG: hypothetical protein CNE89_06320 [Sphingomonadaceae bacterium MED-G03]